MNKQNNGIWKVFFFTSMMSSGNKKMEQPSFRATLIMYVAFNFFSSAIIEQKKRSPLIWSVLSSKLGYSSLVDDNAARNLTTFTLGNKVPIDNPRLHSTEKLKEENPIRQALILEKSHRFQNTTSYHLWIMISTITQIAKQFGLFEP